MFHKLEHYFNSTVDKNPQLLTILSEFWEFCVETHLHTCEVHRLVHQDPCGCLEARRYGHGTIIRDETIRLWVDLLYV